MSSVGWKNCALWLEKKLNSYCPNVIVQTAPTTTYDGKTHTLKNIIASFDPNKKNRVVLFAHWDTRHIADYDTKNKKDPILGANDGGSGVAVLIELARQFSLQSPNIGVDIILFDAEDYGQPEKSEYPKMENSWCLGSQYWSKNPHKKNYTAKYGILLDMVGAKNATFRFEEISRTYAKHILNKVWKKGHHLGFEKYFVFEIRDLWPELTFHIPPIHSQPHFSCGQIILSICRYHLKPLEYGHNTASSAAIVSHRSLPTFPVSSGDKFGYGVVLV